MAMGRGEARCILRAQLLKRERFDASRSAEYQDIGLFAHDLFGKPLHTRRVKPEGMLFRIMR
jgi:hypothetical protein